MNKEIELALKTYIKLLRAEAAVSGIVSAGELERSGLTISQFAVLEALYHKGELTAKCLSELILKSKGNLTLVIDNLQSKGLVERKPCEKDRRRTYIVLTAEGRDLIQDIFPRHARSIFNCMKILTPDEQRELGVLCSKLGKGLKEE